MKNIILIFILCFTGINANAQYEEIPSPEFVNTIYVIADKKLSSLEKQEAIIKKKIKAITFIPYAGLAGGTRSNAVFKSAMSNVRFNSNRLRFIYEPAVMVDPDQNIKIIPLESDKKRNQRTVQTGSSSVFRSKDNELPYVPFTYKKYKEKYIILEVNNLVPGEYGIIVSSNAQSNAELKYQLFGIN